MMWRWDQSAVTYLWVAMSSQKLLAENLRRRISVPMPFLRPRVWREHYNEKWKEKWKRNEERKRRYQVVLTPMRVAAEW
jgi:hypothetical protein